jgi:nitrogen fixation NifU-like protein
MYSPQLLDHFQNPRNAGDLAGADAVVTVENPACGDVLQLSVKLDAGRIATARFKAKGCVAAMACGSVLTELMVGRTIDEASKLRREDVIAAAGGLPPSSGHAAQLAMDGLAAVLRKAERGSFGWCGTKTATKP